MELSSHLLEALADCQREPEKILSLFGSAGLDKATLTRLNTTADAVHPYSRNVLSAAPACEVMLARWAPNRPCAPHDHGKSAGWVFYLEQDFEEQAYEWRGSELASAGRFRHRAGTFTEVRREEIHSCVSSGPGLSLHVYFPRIERMRVYDLSARRTVTVADDCGAWIPEPAAQRVEEVGWT